MKPRAFLISIQGLLATAILLGGSAIARTWTSADGNSTFDGELKSYDPATGNVTIQRPDGQVTFSQDRLSSADIEFLKSQKDKVARAATATKVTALPDELPDPNGEEADTSKPVKVFILMGQSNMLGFGKINGGDGSLDHAIKTKGLYKHLQDDDGNWTTRKDVRNVFIMGKGFSLQTNDWLTAEKGHGRGKGQIGPEVQIGSIMGELFEEPVMILKVCIGNRSLGWDLLPPSVKAYDYEGKLQPGYGEIPATAGSGEKYEGKEWYAGTQWDTDTGNAKKVLEDLDTYYPGAKDYEVAGFFWWQGDKDMRNPAHFSNYEKHLVALIKDLRNEFKAPNAPFVSASLGQTKEGSTGGDGVILEAMKAVASDKYPEFKGNVGFVYTHPLSKGGSSSGHYSGNAETYMNIGNGMGRAMADLFLGK